MTFFSFADAECMKGMTTTLNDTLESWYNVIALTSLSKYYLRHDSSNFALTSTEAIDEAITTFRGLLETNELPDRRVIASLYCV